MQAKAQGKSNVQTKKQDKVKAAYAKSHKTVPKKDTGKIDYKKMGSKMPDTPFKKEVRKSEEDRKKKVNKVKNFLGDPKKKGKAQPLKKGKK